ncbi:MAG: hypothetical protein ACK5OB_03830 [Pirellula sp.]|jgi:hypothetical protein
MAIWVLFAVIGVGVAVAVTVARKLDRKRRDALVDRAKELGLEIHWYLPAEDREPFQRFDWSKKGSKRSSDTTIVADTGETRLLVFEHVVITDNGKGQHRNYYLIGMARDRRLDAPPLTLQPRTWQTTVAGWFGYQAIEFSSDPAFGSMFCVRGTSPEGIETFLNPKFREHAKTLPKLQMATSGDTLIVIQSRTRLKAENLRTSLDATYRIFKLLLPE